MAAPLVAPGLGMQPDGHRAADSFFRKKPTYGQIAADTPRQFPESDSASR